LFLESLEKFPKNIFFTQKEPLLVTSLLLLCKILPNEAKKIEATTPTRIPFFIFWKQIHQKGMDFGLGSPDL